MVTQNDIRRGIGALGLSDQPICVHASLRSFGGVVSGPTTVIEGILAEGCTLMVPTFSWRYALPPPPDVRPARNGWDYDSFASPTGGIGRVYTSEMDEIDRDTMGALPTAVIARPGRVRGRHPLNSFTALGPVAHELIDTQTPVDVFAPLQALADAGGSVVLMGVGLNKMTLLHLAERKAGRNLFRRWANGINGKPLAVEVGGCSDGFGHFLPLLAPLVTERRIGESIWWAYPAREALDVAVKAIRENPRVTHCGDPNCERCNDAVLGGPILTV